MEGCMKGVIALTLAMLLLAGCGVNYKFALKKPTPSDRIAFEDENIAVSFDVRHKEIYFTLANKTDGAIQIVWDSSSYVDAEGSSHKVLHKIQDSLDGYNDYQASKRQSPSTIGPGAQLNDYLFPVDYVIITTESDTTNSASGVNVTSTTTTFNRKPLLPQLLDNAQKIVGKSLKVSLAMQIDGSARQYDFEFEIADAVGR
jgi:hypothetical protein